LDRFIDQTIHTPVYAAGGFSFEFVGQLPSWDQKLSPEEFYVLRRGGTQPAFAVPYEKKPAPGFYSCRACGTKLFDADTQFDARCGWPAFWKPTQDDAVRLISDNSMGMRRVEVRCKGCDSHLGHVFEGEGFGFETDQRYCINSICLVRHHE
jgi:peptide-methionine (R)-S-oxide reductase